MGLPPQEFSALSPELSEICSDCGISRFLCILDFVDSPYNLGITELI
jgi:hypothetical protein